MLLEVHMLQNFAPSNLNRDDTGSPKDCEFGGYRRARISSQCQKRAIRQEFQDLLPAHNLGVRTKRLVEAVADRLIAVGHPEEEARPVAATAVASYGLGLDKDGETQYLIFLGRDELDAIAAACRDNWATLAAVLANHEVMPKLDALARANLVTANQLLDQTNEVGLASVGDNLIDVTTVPPQIIEEYRQPLGALVAWAQAHEQMRGLP